MNRAPPPSTFTYSRKASKRRQRAPHSSDDDSDYSQRRSKVRIEATKPTSSLTTSDAGQNKPFPQAAKANDVVHDSDSTALASIYPRRVRSPRGGSKKVNNTPTQPQGNSSQDQSRTPSRPSTPLVAASGTSSSRSPVNHASRTPVKASTSLPAPSPLTPLSATPIKRTSTHPMDLASTPSKSKHSVDPLSELFDFSSKRLRRDNSRSLQSKPSQPVAKRMLGRTKTEQSIPDEPSVDTSFDSLVSKSSSVSVGLPQFPQPSHVIDSTVSGSPAFPTLSVPEEQSQCSVPGPSTTPLQPSSLRTYAGRSRSFLVELPTDSNPDSGVDADDLGLEIRESYKDLRLRWGVDKTEDDFHPAVSLHSSPEPENGRKGKGKAKDRAKPVLPPNMMNDLKSVTELRSKGESRRFMDEVGYLFEGMDRNVGVRVRRGSALELVTKLCDTDFARRAKATDFRSRAWDALRSSGAGEGDKVLDAILVLFAALVSQSPHEVTELTQKADFVPVLWEILTTLDGADPLELLGSGANERELKMVGIGKAEKLTLISLRSVIINKSGLLLEEENPSLHRLLSQALASLPPSVHQPSHLAVLYPTLQAGLSPLLRRLSGYASGLPLLPDPSEVTHPLGVPQFNHIANCLELLDSFLLGRWATAEEQPQLYHNMISGNGQDDLAEMLSTLCAVCNIILRNSEFENIIQTANRCLESVLRVLINISHENMTWCELLLHQRLMIPVISSLIATSLRASHDEEVGERDAQEFDRLCLALGLLTNLVQVNEDAKDLCRETKLDPSCRALRQCAYGCSCPNVVNVLQCLVSVYEQHFRTEDDDPGTYIIRGHLAVLFGLLMRGSSANQDIILDALPGTGLKGLIQHAKEFVGLYKEFMARVARGEEHNTGNAEDDEEVTAQIKVRDGATQDVAQVIIKFLEDLMDV